MTRGQCRSCFDHMTTSSRHAGGGMGVRGWGGGGGRCVSMCVCWSGEGAGGGGPANVSCPGPNRLSYIIALGDFLTDLPRSSQCDDGPSRTG